MNGLLSRMEVVVAGVLLLVFLLWAGTRCKETKVPPQDEATVQTVADSLANDKKPTEGEASNDILAEALRKKKEEMDAAAKADSIKKVKATETAIPSTSTNSTTAPPQGKLYITIDKLKLRSSPGLKSKVLGELPLFSEVYFMEEVTDSIYTLSLGKETAEEPYVKVKTKRGTVGWVYGAGVNYYKKKREGVLE